MLSGKRKGDFFNLVFITYRLYKKVEDWASIHSGLAVQANTYGRGVFPPYTVWPGCAGEYTRRRGFPPEGGSAWSALTSVTSLMEEPRPLSEVEHSRSYIPR